MPQCKDCQKETVKYMILAFSLLIAWCGYLTVNAHANDNKDAVYHERVDETKKQMDKVVKTLDEQTKAFNKLAIAIAER